MSAKLALAVVLTGSLCTSAEVAARQSGQLELRFPDSTARAMRSASGVSWSDIRRNGLVLADKASPVLSSDVRIVVVAVREGRAVRRWVSPPIKSAGGQITLSGDRYLPDDGFLPAEHFLRGKYSAGSNAKSIAIPDAIRASDSGSATPVQPFYDQRELQAADGLLFIAFPDVCFTAATRCQGALTQPVFAMPQSPG